MDLQSRKILFVQEFLKLQSEKTISQLEKVLFREAKTTAMEPMTIEQYEQRINQSINDSENGRLTDADDLLAEIKTWK